MACLLERWELDDLDAIYTIVSKLPKYVYTDLVFPRVLCNELHPGCIAVIVRSGKGRFTKVTKEINGFFPYPRALLLKLAWCEDVLQHLQLLVLLVHHCARRDL